MSLAFQNSKIAKKFFQENRMQTFAEGLRYYNDLDVAPGLEALEKIN